MPKKSKRKYSKFKNKVLFVLLLTGVIPLLVVSFVSLITVMNTRSESVSELQLQVINGTNERIKRYLDQKIEAFNLVIDRNVDNVSEINLNSLKFIAQGLKKSTGNIYRLSFIDKNGKEVVNISSIEGGKASVLKDVSSELGFKEAISGKNYFGPVENTFAGPVMEMDSRIENNKRVIIGVIRAEVDLNPIKEFISRTKIGKKGFIYLVDNQGDLIASSNPNIANPGENLIYIPQIKSLINAGIHNGLMKIDRYVNPLGQRVFFLSKSIEGTKWFIVSEWPWGDAFEVIRVMIASFLGIILISLILIILSSLFFARLVVKPLEILSHGTDEISKGNFDYNIHIKTGDELERLGESFNKMTRVLKENKKLKDEFVFIAAHELRTPVTVIKYYLSMILNGDFGEVNERIRKPLEISLELNERLVELVKDLLEVARSEFGKMNLEMKPVSLNKSIDEILEGFTEKAKKRNVKLVYKKPKAEIIVKTDVYKLKEVISNLIDNAIKYTINGGNVVIDSGVKGKMAVVSVEDNGIGIDKDNIKKLFSKFYRVKTKETKNIEGTGLGLFICKQIVENMGGKIWVESQIGKGSTFSFSLPLASTN